MAPKPTAPSAPKPAAATYAGAAPVTMKASPKKETARIQVAPDPHPPVPKATVRMQQTQPLTAAPAPVVRSAPAIAVVETSEEEEDSMTKILSAVVAVAAVISVIVSYLTYAG